MIISPERLDPFADGKICHYLSPHHNLPIYYTLSWFTSNHWLAVLPFDCNAIPCSHHNCSPLVSSCMICTTLRHNVITVLFSFCLCPWAVLHYFCLRPNLHTHSPGVCARDHVHYGAVWFKGFRGQFAKVCGLLMACVNVEGWTISWWHSVAYDLLSVFNWTACKWRLTEKGIGLDT